MNPISKVKNDVDFALWSLHYVDVGSVSSATEVCVASIFRVKACTSETLAALSTSHSVKIQEEKQHQ